MAAKHGVWGIDIGLTAIKALRCVAGAPGELVADKFDYIEFPKMLNQPEVDIEGEVQGALKQFLSRNKLVGDRVAISVPGQSGLSRFFRPPPVDQKTLPDIVKYEVKQQIPFPIEDVIWDWQKQGGVEVDGRLIDAEVGLFAMKRDGVFRALKPFDDAGIDVDIVQLSPLAVFNFSAHEIFKRTISKTEEASLEGNPKSVVVMSMGTDTTDLIVTNGQRLWMRNLPLGGNHFTKQLSRELKLTHAKAEQLKKNLRQAEDPRQVLQAMRPVFNDLVNEVQRSITFFRSLDKTADIKEMVVLGNAAQLPGLRQYLGSQLELDMVKLDGFQRLTGSGVVDQTSFQENLPSFAPAYGLCLQASKLGQLRTNLLPREIHVSRIIESKKPWVLTAVSLMLLGATTGLIFSASKAFSVSPDFKSNAGTAWSKSFADVDQKVAMSKKYLTTDEEQVTTLKNLKTIGNELMSSSEDKTRWLELLKAIESALPTDARIEDRAVDPGIVPFDGREVIYVDYIESEFQKDVTEWATAMKPVHDGMFGQKAAAADEAAPGVAAAPAAGTAEALPTGPGWIIEIRGHHFRNGSDILLTDMETRSTFVINRFIKPLMSSTFTLPGQPEAGGGEFQYQDAGILLPTLVAASQDAYPVELAFSLSPADDSDPDGPSGDSGSGGTGGGQMSTGGIGGTTGMSFGGVRGGGGGSERGGAGGENGAEDSNVQKAKQFDFVVQFVWQPKNKAERIAARQKRLDADKAAADAAATAAAAAAASTDANAESQ